MYGYKMISTENLNFDKLNGIIPAIIVDKSTKNVLMLGFMNEEALQKTIDTRLVTFFSRSRKELWTKGETSENYLHVVDIKPDCDNDTLLIYVKPEGVTCHTGKYSCFDIDKNISIDFLQVLFELITERKNNLPENSYTTKLFQSGSNRIIQKVGEEAIETIIAAKNDNKNELINEVSDLIYHLFVLLVNQGITLKEIVSNLNQRHE